MDENVGLTILPKDLIDTIHYFLDHSGIVSYSLSSRDEYINLLGRLRYRCKILYGVDTDYSVNWRVVHYSLSSGRTYQEIFDDAFILKADDVIKALIGHPSIELDEQHYKHPDGELNSVVSFIDAYDYRKRYKIALELVRFYGKLTPEVILSAEFVLNHDEVIDWDNIRNIYNDIRNTYNDYASIIIDGLFLLILINFYIHQTQGGQVYRTRGNTEIFRRFWRETPVGEESLSNLFKETFIQSRMKSHPEVYLSVIPQINGLLSI